MKQGIISIIAAASLWSGNMTPAQASEDIGAYLAARQASYDNDYTAAARYFTQALAKDPSNPRILANAVIAELSLGQLDTALPIARKIEADGLKSQVANMVMMADEAAREDYDAVLARIDDGRGVGVLADGLVAAWVHRAKGDMEQALAKFDAVASERGLRNFALYHKALALASVGDYESADAIFAGKDGPPLQRTRLGTISWLEVLSQLDRNQEAIAVIDNVFGTDLYPELEKLRARLGDGDSLPFTRIRTPQDGIAEVFFTLGQALTTENTDDYVLLYSRVAEYLKPDHIDAMIFTAELLDRLDRYELANQAYKRVPQDHPNFHVAELGRVESLRRAGKTDAAIEVLTLLTRSQPDLPVVHVSMGDLYRQLEDFAKAVQAYDRALELYAKRETEQWFVHYARGIALERIGEWDRAEADFRKALALQPEQPQVLNYLGYSLVEKQMNLDEALSMIKRAVAAQPDSGYIVDSLGWVLYRLGRYDEAIVHMERAAELEPVDPVVNDHLGDVLWAVGRYSEAEFQWKRALSFVDEENPSPDLDPERVRRKLESGLDQVLSEEGAPALKMVDDDG